MEFNCKFYPIHWKLIKSSPQPAFTKFHKISIPAAAWPQTLIYYYIAKVNHPLRPAALPQFYYLLIAFSLHFQISSPIIYFYPISILYLT